MDCKGRVDSRFDQGFAYSTNTLDARAIHYVALTGLLGHYAHDGYNHSVPLGLGRSKPQGGGMIIENPSVLHLKPCRGGIRADS